MSPNQDDPYTHVAKGALKIKGLESSGKKKKKKEKKLKKLGEVTRINETPVLKPSKTKAELAVLEMREKVQNERTKQKASITHRELVVEFNRKLDMLTEHFEVPKVSWTK